MSRDAFREDVWLGERLGKPAWLVQPDVLDSVRELEDFLSELRDQQRSFFVHARTSVDRPDLVRLLEDVGLRLMDTNVVLEKTMAADAGNLSRSSVRIARSEDETAVRAIAERSFSLDRFHLDPQVSQVQADAIQGDWAANFFRGQRGDWMGVAETDQGVAGFLSLLLRKDRAVIDLIAVDAAARGRGLGRKLVALAEAEHHNLGLLQVGTQIGNISSIRFYNRCGFQYLEALYVFHLHA